VTCTSGVNTGKRKKARAVAPPDWSSTFANAAAGQWGKTSANTDLFVLSLRAEANTMSAYSGSLQWSAEARRAAIPYQTARPAPFRISSGTSALHRPNVADNTSSAQLNPSAVSSSNWSNNTVAY
jgi:hypothetical protein